MNVAVETAVRGRKVSEAPFAGEPATFQSYLVATIFLLQGCGLLLTAFAIELARNGSPWGEPVFWQGMFTIWVPAVVAVVHGDLARPPRIALVVGTGLALYLVKMLSTPLSFDPHDELLHWRTARDIVGNERLFNENAMLPVSPLYPGLEIATSALVKLTDLSTYVAGTVLTGVARFIMVLALYLLYERIGRSSWLASVATLVYMANPKFLFFDASYAYESLALPLALLALCLIARRDWIPAPRRLALFCVVALLVAAVAVTHHITSFVLVGVLTLLALASSALREAGARAWFVGVALFGAASVLAWMFFVASDVLGYLGPPLGAGVHELIELIRREGSPRELFVTYGGEEQPLRGRVAALVFTATTVLSLPLAWLWIWRRRRFDAWLVVFVVGSLAYPASGLFRFTEAAAEAADRSAAFVFVAVAFLFVLALAQFRRWASTTLRTVAATLVMCLLLFGGVALSGPHALRLPGPYRVSADTRSVEKEGLAAASWAEDELGADNRFAADRVNRLLMFAYGRQRPVTTLADGIDVSPLFFNTTFFGYERRLIRRGRLEYLVVDYRLTQALPLLGVYYDSAERDAYAHRTPIRAEAYDKFDRLTSASRVFDSGNIIVYDVSRIATDQ